MGHRDEQYTHIGISLSCVTPTLVNLNNKHGPNETGNDCLYGPFDVDNGNDPRTRPQTGFFQPTWIIMEEKPEKKNHGGGIMEQDFWEAFGKHLGSIWEAFGKHLGRIWEASEKHLADIWEAFGET